MVRKNLLEPGSSLVTDEPAGKTPIVLTWHPNDFASDPVRELVRRFAAIEEMYQTDAETAEVLLISIATDLCIARIGLEFAELVCRRALSRSPERSVAELLSEILSARNRTEEARRVAEHARALPADLLLEDLVDMGSDETWATLSQDEKRAKLVAFLARRTSKEDE